jgi:hypothetical protein
MSTRKRGAAGAPGSYFSGFAASVLASPRWAGAVLIARRSPVLGERGLAVSHQQILVSRLRSEHVVHFLEPSELGFQVPNALLEATHFRYQTVIGTADVAE